MTGGHDGVPTDAQSSRANRTPRFRACKAAIRDTSPGTHRLLRQARWCLRTDGTDEGAAPSPTRGQPELEAGVAGLVPVQLGRRGWPLEDLLEPPRQLVLRRGGEGVGGQWG